MVDVALLHMEPNSPDAKVFEEFENATRGSTTSPPASGKTYSFGSNYTLNLIFSTLNYTR